MLRQRKPFVVGGSVGNSLCKLVSCILLTKQTPKVEIEGMPDHTLVVDLVETRETGLESQWVAPFGVWMSYLKAQGKVLTFC